MYRGRLILTNGFFPKAAIGLFFSMAALAPARADVYQDAITKAFPGFQILSRSEFLPEVQKEVKGNPGLVTGRFNDDDLEDFAAIIRSDVKKRFASEYDYYDGKTVVRHRLPTSGYACQTLGTRSITLPNELYLYRVEPGFECPDIGDGRSITTKRDAIGSDLMPSKGGSVRMYIDGRYFTCVGH